MPETRLGRRAFRHLDASVGASGPHDFAVRNLHHSSARRSIAHRSKGPALPSPAALTQTASTASRPAFRDDRERPSVGRDGEGYAGDLGEKRSGIFLRMGWTGESAADSLTNQRGDGRKLFEMGVIEWYINSMGLRDDSELPGRLVA